MTSRASRGSTAAAVQAVPESVGSFDLLSLRRIADRDDLAASERAIVRAHLDEPLDTLRDGLERALFALRAPGPEFGVFLLIEALDEARGALAAADRALSHIA